MAQPRPRLLPTDGGGDPLGQAEVGHHQAQPRVALEHLVPGRPGFPFRVDAEQPVPRDYPFPDLVGEGLQPGDVLRVDVHHQADEPLVLPFREGFERRRVPRVDVGRGPDPVVLRFQAGHEFVVPPVSSPPVADDQGGGDVVLTGQGVVAGGLVDPHARPGGEGALQAVLEQVDVGVGALRHVGSPFGYGFSAVRYWARSPRYVSPRTSRERATSQVASASGSPTV